MRADVRKLGKGMARRAVDRVRPELAVLPLRHLRDARSRRVAEALLAGADGLLTDDERSWADRIESLRVRLSTSTEPLPDAAEGPRTVGAVASEASQTPDTGRVLLKLVRAWRPGFAVELGTGVGISTAYQAAALAMNGRGRLVTVERSEKLADVARKNLADLGFDNVEVVVGGFEETLASLTERHRIDYAFVDGDRGLKPTLRYYDQLFLGAAQDQLCVLDDIDWSDDMALAWRRISRHGPVDWATTHGRLGICRARG